MSTSNRFDSYLRSTRKKRHELSEEELLEHIKEAFTSCMTSFPEAMNVDLFGFFIGSAIDAVPDSVPDSVPDAVPDSDVAAEVVADAYSRIDTIISAAEKLQRVVELFDENYEVAEDDLSDAEWETVRQCVDDFALDLDTHLITYIMRFVVKRGLIG